MHTKFGFYDVFIIILIMSISFSIGVFFGFQKKIKRFHKYFSLKKRENFDSNNGHQVAEYLIANSSMGAIPIAFSLLGSFFSATALLGNPAEVYTFGIVIWANAFAVSICPLIGAFITGPFFFRLKVMSVFEYLQLRFDSNGIRRIGMCSYLLRAFIGSAIFIYGPATSLFAITNIDQKYAIAIIGSIGTFYTAIGGIKAVIWADFFQVFVMFLSLIIIIIKGLYDIGGFSNLWTISLNGGKFLIFKGSIFFALTLLILNSRTFLNLKIQKTFKFQS